MTHVGAGSSLALGGRTLRATWAADLLEGMRNYHLPSGGRISRLALLGSTDTLTLCNPTDCSMQAFPVHHQLMELTQTHVHRVGDAIQKLYSLVFRAICSSEQLHSSCPGLPILVIHGISLLLSWIPEFCI